MSDISIPSLFEDLASAGNSFGVTGKYDANDLTVDVIENAITDEMLTESADDAFEVVYCALVHFNALEEEARSSFVQSMLFITTSAADLINDQCKGNVRANCKKILYFMQHICIRAEAVYKSSDSKQADSAKGAKSSKGGKKTNSKNDQQFVWYPSRHSYLEVMLKAFSNPLMGSIWPMGIVPEAFLSSAWAYNLQLLEERPVGLSVGTAHADIATRELCLNVITSCTSLFGSAQNSGSFAALSTALLDGIMRTEHMSHVAATLCGTQHNNTHSNKRSNNNNTNSLEKTAKAANAAYLIAAELVTEISHLNTSNLSSGGLKNVAAFLEDFANVNPECMAVHFPVLVKQLDSNAHQIRSAMLGAMGHIVVHAHTCLTAGTASPLGANLEEDEDEEEEDVEEAEEKKKKKKSEENDEEHEQEQDGKSDTPSSSGSSSSSSSDRDSRYWTRLRDSLLDMIVERTHDCSPYTRAVALKIWVALLEKDSVPVRRATHVAEIALDRLSDKTVGVRKNAAVLLSAVLDHNPFAGNLDSSRFEAQILVLRDALQLRTKQLRVVYRESKDVVAGEDADVQRTVPTLAELLRECSLKAGVRIITNPDGTTGTATVAAAPKLVGRLPGCPEGDDDEEEEEEDGEEDEEDEEEFLASSDYQEDSLVVEIKAKLEYCSTASVFVSVIEQALPKVDEMLKSKAAWDVTEALRFCTRAINFSIKGALSKFKSAFSLVWHQDLAIKSEIISAFVGVYLTDGSVAAATAGESTSSSAAAAASSSSSSAQRSTALLPAHETAVNLEQLVLQCTEGEIVSLEQIIGELFKGEGRQQQSIDSDVVDAVWARCASNNSTSAACALRIIAMVAKCSPDILSVDKIKLITSVGFNKRVLEKADFAIMHSACLCLQATPSFVNATFAALKKQSGATAAAEYYQNSEMSQALLAPANSLTSLILADFPEAGEEAATRRWFSVCEEAIQTMFHTHPCPDRVLAHIIAVMYTNMTSGNGSNNSSSVYYMSRFLFVLGQAALSSLVYTEAISAHAKNAPKQKTTASAAATANSSGDKKKKKRDSSLVKDDDDDEDDDESNGADAMEAEMGMAAAADSEHERLLNHVIEKELVINGLLGKFLPLITRVVTNPDCTPALAHPLLRETSINALSRYMATSAELCENNLALLATVLECEKSPSVRTSIIIAMGDLAFRFPNAVEPWTERMYARLRDDDASVRYNTLMVITHLVLNDMIKVKGQVSHVAMSLNDKSDTIRDLARLFFLKLAERSNNPVYNLLGDIIGVFSAEKVAPVSAVAAGDDDNVSTISTGGAVSASVAGGGSVLAQSAVVSTKGSVAALRGLTDDEFKTTMHFLLSFVSKDKQADGLLERLLARMGIAESMKQRRNLAFCISELSISEKGVRILIDMFKNIKDALYDNAIYESFQTLVSRVRKGNRPSPNGGGAEGASSSSSSAAAAAAAAAVAAAESGVPSAPVVSVAGTKSALEELEQLMLAVRRCAQGETDEDGIQLSAIPEGENEDAGDDTVTSVNASQQQQQQQQQPRKKAVLTAAKGVKAGKTAAKGSTKGGKISRRHAAASSDDEEEDDDEEDASSDDYEGYSDDEEIEGATESKNSTPPAKGSSKSKTTAAAAAASSSRARGGGRAASRA